VNKLEIDVNIPEKQKKRMFEKIINNGSCWIWTGAKNNHGYGQIGIKNYGKTKTVYVHRLLYTAFFGKIDGKFELDHLCRVPACVNPNHLEPVTHRENTMRGFGVASFHAKKIVCLRGHKFDRVNNRGNRVCGICKNDLMKKRRHELGISKKYRDIKI
jgi:hypothetical protein